MQAIVRQCALQGWPAQVVGVLSNRPDAKGLAFAQEQGIATAVVDHRAYESREAFDDALSEAIDALRPDGVILAGFMRILGERFVQRYAQRLLNIHPSLLPAFPGLDTHQRALDAGCKVAGATVHFVTAELDHGPIVMQSVVAVRADDDAHTLAQRVLRSEHVIYPQSVRWWVQDELVVQDGRVRHRAGLDQTCFFTES
ncbi:MAG: hypothetical protein RI949_75 [Pseudomonadota bacterium]|jgi:phosphoribosylglycinamide formyltransferase-1